MEYSDVSLMYAANWRSRASAFERLFFSCDGMVFPARPCLCAARPAMLLLRTYALREEVAMLVVSCSSNEVVRRLFVANAGKVPSPINTFHLQASIASLNVLLLFSVVCCSLHEAIVPFAALWA